MSVNNQQGLLVTEVQHESLFQMGWVKKKILHVPIMGEKNELINIRWLEKKQKTKSSNREERENSCFLLNEH